MTVYTSVFFHSVTSLTSFFIFKGTIFTRNGGFSFPCFPKSVKHVAGFTIHAFIRIPLCYGSGYVQTAWAWINTYIVGESREMEFFTFSKFQWWRYVRLGYKQDKGGEGKNCHGSTFKLFDNIWEICRKCNVASSTVYKWREKLISAGTAAMKHAKSTVKTSLTKEINELNGIID